MNLYDLSWKVTEEEYRAYPALHYSKIKEYAKNGFNCLKFPPEETISDSMVFGSAVDAIITEGAEGFNSKFFVSDFKIPTDSVRSVVDRIYESHSGEKTFDDVSDGDILNVCNEYEYRTSWKADTRIRSIRENGTDYYNWLVGVDGRTIISQETYNKVQAVVSALRTSPATSELFGDDTENVIHEYQLKFKSVINGVEYKCMPDLLVTDHTNMIVYPVDLKTSGKYEWDFPYSFVSFRYDIQARLYWKILRGIMDSDDTFKNYTLSDWVFVVVNKDSLIPLKWVYEDTSREGVLVYGDKLKFDDPVKLGGEIASYMSQELVVPENIKLDSENSIIKWLERE